MCKMIDKTKCNNKHTLTLPDSMSLYETINSQKNLEAGGQSGCCGCFPHCSQKHLTTKDNKWQPYGPALSKCPPRCLRDASMPLRLNATPACNPSLSDAQMVSLAQFAQLQNLGLFVEKHFVLRRPQSFTAGLEDDLSIAIAVAAAGAGAGAVALQWP